jgi:hypothetical protein
MNTGIVRFADRAGVDHSSVPKLDGLDPGDLHKSLRSVRTRAYVSGHSPGKCIRALSLSRERVEVRYNARPQSRG